MNRRRARGAAGLLAAPRDLWLALRMTAWAIALSPLKHAVALPRLARLMWREGSAAPDQGELERVVRLATIAARFRPAPHRDNCLERSLIAYRYLSALNLDPHIVVAVRTDDRSAFGHAWVTVAGQPVGAGDVGPFTPVVEIGSRGAPLAPG